VSESLSNPAPLPEIGEGAPAPDDYKTSSELEQD
jgi:hypothetical protein